MTKAHNLYNYLRDKYGSDPPKKGGTMKSMDNDSFALRFYNLSDKEFEQAIKDPEYSEDNDCGLHAEWD